MSFLSAVRMESVWPWTPPCIFTHAPLSCCHWAEAKE